MGYVESAIEAKRRLRLGWTQDLCKHCGKVYVWHQPVKRKVWKTALDTTVRRGH